MAYGAIRSKRKRRATSNQVVFALSRRAKKKARSMQLGYVRTGGFYGRFAGSSAEAKFMDTTIGSTSVNTTGNILSTTLNAVPQNTTESGRIGRKIVMRSISMKGSILVAESNSTNKGYQRVRFIVYKDKQCNGATAQLLDILETVKVDSFRNLANTARFSILMDKTWNLNAAAAAGNGTSDNDLVEFGKGITWNKRCNIPVEFNGVGGGLSEIRSNNVGVMAIIDTSEPVTRIGYTVRIRYNDS